MSPSKNKETAGTRRNKRKSDDADKSSPGKSSKQVSTTTATGSSTTSARHTPRSTRKGAKSPRVKAAPKASPASKRSLSEKEKEAFKKLAKKAKLNNKLLSELTAEMETEELSPARRDDDVYNDDDDDGAFPSEQQRVSSRGEHRSIEPTQPTNRRGDANDAITSNVNDSTRVKNNLKQRKSPKPVTRRSGRKPVLQHDEEVDSDLDSEESNSDVDNNDEEDNPGSDNDILDITEEDGDTIKPNLGLSDEEQEISFNCGTQKDGGYEAPTVSMPNETPASEPLPQPVTLTETRPNAANPDQQLALAPPVVPNRFQNQETTGTDISIVLNVLAEVKQAILEDVGRSLKQAVDEIKKEGDNIGKLQEQISEIASVITTTASALFIKKQASHRRLKEIQNKLCLLPALFTKQFVLKVLPRVTIGFFLNLVKAGSNFSSVETSGLEFLSTLYFSRQPNETRAQKFSSEIGRIYSKFRHSLLLSSFLAMQENSFRTFRTETLPNTPLDPAAIGGEEETSTVISPSLIALTQPFWLKNGYVGTDHCLSAATRQERSGGSETIDDTQSNNTDIDELQTHADSDSQDVNESSQSSGKQRLNQSGPITHDEIALEAATMVYKIFTPLLNKSRHASRIQLFHDGMYLFVGWRPHKCTVDQNTLKIRWEKSQTTDIEYIDDLPRTRVIRPNERHSEIKHDMDAVDSSNLTHLKTLIATHPELCLIVQHDVLVKGTPRLLRYRVSLIEMACRALSSYTTLESVAHAKDILCTDKRCLKAVLLLSIGLRKLMERAVNEINSTTTVPWHNHVTTKAKKGQQGVAANDADSTENTRTSYRFEKFNGMCLDRLQPAPTKQKNLLNNMLLSMTEEEFNARSLQANVRPLNNTSATGSREKERITANESNNVFGF